MARVLVEGFESGSSSSIFSGSGYGVIASTLFGSKYLLRVGYLWGSVANIILPSIQTDVYLMFRYMFTTDYSTDTPSKFFRVLDNNGTVLFSLGFENATQTLKLFFGDMGTELDTGTTMFLSGVQYRIEVHYRPANTNGIIQVKVDGKPVEIEYIGDTTPGLENIRLLSFYNDGYTTAYFDDIIVDDTDWIGNSVVLGVVPDGPGEKMDWKSSLGEFDVFNKLLLHFDGTLTDSSTNAVTVYNLRNYMFTDSSTVAKTITTYGNAQLAATQCKFGDCAGVFDGNGDYLQVAYTPDFSFGTSDFTMAVWVYLNALPTSDAWPTNWSSHMALLGVGTPGVGDGCNLVLGQTRIILNSNDSQFLYGTHGMSTGQWYHVAVVRSGSNFYLFVDGAQVATKTSTASMGTGNGFYIGSETGQGAWFSGYMDEAIVSSQALWTENFTPQTEAYTADANTKLLCHFDYNDLAPTFSTDNYKFGGTSMFFSGSLGYLYATAGSTFAINTEKFAVDCWVRAEWLGVGRHTIFDNRAANTDTSAGFLFGVENRKLIFYSNGQIRLTGLTELEDLTWYHVALVGNKYSIKIYLNGVYENSTYITTYNFTQNTPTIGACNNRNSDFWNGYIDEFRLSIGTFRWFRDFTPRTAAYSGGNEDNNWSTVDEQPPNDTDYIYTDEIDATDTYIMTPLDSLARKIKSVKISGRCKLLGEPDVSAVQYVCRHNDIEYTSPNIYAPSDFNYPLTTYIWDKHPGTSDTWTKVTLEECEFGIKAVE